MRVELQLPADSVVRRWDLGAQCVSEGADAVVFDPRGPAPSQGPAIAFLDAGADGYGLLHPDAMGCCAALAPAYAGDRLGLISALAFATGAATPVPPGCVRYLGALGTASAARLEVGTAVEIGARCVIGRSPSNTLMLRQGAHSDQNIVARRHAILTPADGGVLVVDCESTNGTYVAGQRAETQTFVPAGAELAIAGCFRVLVG